LERYKEVNERPRFADKLAERVMWAALAIAGATVIGYFGG